MPGVVATKAVGLLGRGKQAIAAAGEAALQAFGNSTADVTKGEFAEAGRDAATGAALGGGLNVAGQVVGKGFKAAKDYAVKKLGAGSRDELVDRIMNEVASGPDDLKTTPTKQKRLDHSRDAIGAEVVDGPDAELVRNAFLSDAKTGREMLQKPLKDLRAVREADYEAFEAAGRSHIKPDDYVQRLREKVAEEAQAGHGNVATTLKGVISRFESLIQDAKTGNVQSLEKQILEIREAAQKAAEGNNPFRAKELVAQANDIEKALTDKAWKPDLLTVRGFTTEAQETAVANLGALNEHQQARIKNVASAVTTGIMDDLLTAAAKGDKKLEAHATSIRANNKRFNAILTIDDALAGRQWKENNADGPIKGLLKQSATAAALGGAGGATQGNDFADGAQKAGMGALVGVGLRKGLPKIGQKIEQSITTAQLKALQALKTGGKEAADEARRLGISERVIRMYQAATKPDQSEE